MRRPILMLLFASLFLLFLDETNAADIQPIGAGSLFSETSYDFKGIPRNTEPRHSFTFTNRGKSDLKLVSARTSCQCTKVFIPEKRVYKPGEKGEVVAQIDGVRFTGIRRATVTATFEQSGSVFEVPLNVTGVVLENVRLTPQKINFLVDEAVAVDAQSGANKIALGERTQKASVLYPSFTDVVVKAESSDPRLKVEIGKAVKTNAGMETPLAVSVKPDASAGYINAIVSIWSNGNYRATPLTLTVTGVVRPPLTIAPPTLTFFTSPDRKKIVKNIVIAASSEFMIKNAECDSKAIECNFSKKSVRPAKVCVLPITFDPSKLQNEAGSTKLKIETTDGRKLYLTTRISSGNFEVCGLNQTDLDAEESAEEPAIEAKEDPKTTVRESVTVARAESQAIQSNNQALAVNQKQASAKTIQQRSAAPSAPSAPYANASVNPQYSNWPQQQSMGGPLGIARGLFR